MTVSDEYRNIVRKGIVDAEWAHRRGSKVVTVPRTRPPSGLRLVSRKEWMDS